MTGAEEAFLSPPVLMHGGLLGAAFCPSVCLSVRLSVCLSVRENTRKKVTRKKFISQELFDPGSPNFVWWWMWTISKSSVKVKVMGERSRSQC